MINTMSHYHILNEEAHSNIVGVFRISNSGKHMNRRKKGLPHPSPKTKEQEKEWTKMTPQVFQDISEILLDLPVSRLAKFCKYSEPTLRRVYNAIDHADYLQKIAVTNGKQARRKMNQYRKRIDAFVEGGDYV